MRKIVISAMIAGAAVVATPAAAQSWGYAQNRGYNSYNANGVVQQINQLQNQVQQAQRRGAISPREANGLRRQVTNVQRNLRLYSRNGLDRREVGILQAQVNQVRQALRTERRDLDRRRG